MKTIFSKTEKARHGIFDDDLQSYHSRTDKGHKNAQVVCFYKLTDSCGYTDVHRCSLKAGKCLFIMKIAEFT